MSQSSLKITESEDERIRTFLHHTFTAQYLCKDKLGKWHGEPVDNILAWLEKQGEQKPNNKLTPIFRVGDIVKHKNGDTVTITQVDTKNQFYCYKGYNGAATIHCDFSFSEQDNWELIEQNPTTWSEDDELKRSTLINVVKKQQGSAIFEGLLPEELIDWLESLKDRSQPQPKQDSTDRFFEGFKKGEQSVIENYGKYGLCNPTKSKWSEEDELHIRKLEDLVKRVWAIAEHENDKETIHEMSDLSFFLKTLKPQLKQEWSKEDEDYFDAIIAKLEVTQEDAALTDNQMNFLKSLKSRVQPKQEWSEEERQTIKDAASFILSCVNIVETKEEEERLEELAGKLQDLKPQSHWKPTKEQMGAIEGAVNDWGFQRLHLNSLYEQLKKLMEE